MSALTSLTVGGVPIFNGGSFVKHAGPSADSGLAGHLRRRDGKPDRGDGVAYTNTLFGANGALVKLLNRQNRGDIIYLLPGYSESITTADMGNAALGGNTASGYSIIGLGVGPQMPTLTWTVATATWILDQAGVEIANVNMLIAGPSAAGALTVALPMTISGAGCRIIGCNIPWGYDATP